VSAHTYYLSYVGSVKRESQSSLDIKQNPIPKITKAKRGKGMTQMVEHLPRKY
jgi:hypothetical protein